MYLTVQCAKPLDAVIVNTNRPSGGNAKDNKKGGMADNADLSTASHNSVAMPNPYAFGTIGHMQHPRYWDPNWADNSQEQTNEERRLFNYLMRNYDTNIRPIKNSSMAIHIRLGITLAQIFDLVWKCSIQGIFVTKDLIIFQLIFA